MPVSERIYDMDIIKHVLSLIIGYLFGSICVAVLLTRHQFREDVRDNGSGNAGATNVARVYGFKAGILTFVGDALKTFVGAGIGWLLAGENGMILGAAGAIVGHCFPVFFGFRGGKGVSVGAAVAFIVDPLGCGVVLAIFALLAFTTRLVSLSSMIASSFLTVWCLMMGIYGPRLYLAIFGALLIIFMHRGNIRRLIRGEEKKFSPGKKK